MSRMQERPETGVRATPRDAHERAPGGAADGDRVRFEMVLRPHRSLTTGGFRGLMAVFAGVSLLAAARMLFVGAWPVAVFFVLDAVLLWLALTVSYRTGRALERIRLTDRRLEVVRILPSRRVRRWCFEPWWTRVELEDRDGPMPRIVLRQRDRRLAIGRFLPPGERRDVAEELRRALGEYRVA